MPSVKASESPAATPSIWDAGEAQRIVAEHVDREGSLLVILQALQAAFGYLPQETVGFVAEALNLSRAEVHGLIGFYHDLRTAPAGRRVLRLCQAEACQARGGRDVTAAAIAASGCALGETLADGRLTLEPVYCLGLCASGPAALLDDAPLGRLTPARVRELVTA
jgi:formate dehydrogenase subunit gamma